MSDQSRREVTIEETAELRYLLHGEIIHGAQYRDAPRRHLPVPYYLAPGPIPRIFSALAEHTTAPTDEMSAGAAGSGVPPVAIIGLGTGGIAMHAAGGQLLTFFENDEEVVDHARSSFSYLEQSPGRIDVSIEDGRAGIERAERRWGMIVVDAFAADTIPAHLLTVEAMSLYFGRLDDPKYVLVNTSLRYVEVEPILANVARAVGVDAYRIDHRPSTIDELGGLFAEPTNWVLLAPSQTPTPSGWRPIAPHPETYPIWRDADVESIPVLR